MSANNFDFKNESEAKSVLEEVRETNNQTNWVVFGYADDAQKTNDWSVVILGKGKGGVEAMRETYFKEESTVFAILAALTNDGKYSMTKHIQINWVGTKVKPLHRARSSQHRVEIYNFGNKTIQLHGEIQALEQKEISDELVAQKLAGSKLEKSGKTTGDNSRETGGAGMKDFQFEDESKVSQLIKDIRDRKKALNWLLLGYKQGDENGNVVVLKSGEGNLSEIKAHLNPKIVAYFILGVQPENEKVAGGDFTQTKHILVTWVGTQCEPLHKARSSQHRVSIYNYTKRTLQLHGELQALNEQELSEQLLHEKLTLSKIRKEDVLRAAAAEDARKKKEREEKRRKGSYHRQGSFTGFAGTSAANAGSPFKSTEDSAAVEIIKECGRDGSDVNWVLFDYETNKVNVKIHSKGNGGLDNFKDQFENDQVMYALVGVAVDEGDYSTIKYMLITWVGSKVRPLHKARSSQHRVTLYTYCKQFVTMAGEFHCLTGEISNQLLLQKLAGSKLVDVGDSASATSKARSTRSRRGSGFRTSSASQSGYTFQEEEKISQLLKNIQDKGNPTNWLVLSHTEGNNKNTIGLIGDGQGGIDTFKSLLKPDQISYGIMCHVFTEHDDSSGNYATRKYIFISWVGPRVRPLAKARSSQHRVQLYSWAKKHLQLHGILQAMQLDEITKEKIEERITGSRN